MDQGIRYSLRDNMAKKILALRKSAGLTQKALSASIGMSGAMVRQIERGKVNPSLNTIMKLADVFDVHPAYFFTDNEYKEQLLLEERLPCRNASISIEGIPSSILAALELYGKDLTPESRAEVLMFIKLVAERDRDMAMRKKDTAKDA